MTGETWDVTTVMCRCGHQWVAVSPGTTPELECPECGHMNEMRERKPIEEGTLTVCYRVRGRIDPGLDDALIETLRTRGYTCWAAGYDYTTGVRDLAFDLIIEEKE